MFDILEGIKKEFPLIFHSLEDGKDTDYIGERLRLNLKHKQATLDQIDYIDAIRKITLADFDDTGGMKPESETARQAEPRKRGLRKVATTLYEHFRTLLGKLSYGVVSRP